MMKKLLLLLMIAVLAAPAAQAAEKNWLGEGDGINWGDDTNWFPVMAPAATDDVIVNALDAPVMLHEPFNIRSLSIGGNVPSSVSVLNSTSGEITPPNSTDIAVLGGASGKLILKGSSGIVTLRGAYKDSETPLSDEPSLVLYFE